VLPLAQPALATVCLFEFLNNWNDFLGPLVYLQNNDLYTLTIGLNDFQNRFGIQPQFQMGASTLTILPLVIVFTVAQLTFVQGITLRGLKG
jgi:multiple sugar transport system permease protein